MICKDMKYTALYWALRFFEVEEDVHVKSYNGYEVIIYAAKQYVDFGEKIKNGRRYYLNSHKSFVVLECVDRLLTNGYLPEQIIISNFFDICLNTEKDHIGISCSAWDDYDGGDFQDFADEEVYYTSRLISGLIEYKGVRCVDVFEFPFGMGSDSYDVHINSSEDFELSGSELISYNGRSKVVRVPEGIKSIAPSAFWNNVFIEEVIFPESLVQLGGDCFYCCNNLKKVNIPANVSIMGNNPFAGCPKLEISNFSSFFKLVGGVLYSADGSNLIHYTISNPAEQFEIPHGVICISKHSFFMCDSLKKIVIPSSVERMENNPFSGCTKLTIENHSAAYHFENGVIYNKWRSGIIGCLNGSNIERLVIPDGVTAINRNSFWNCKGVKSIIIGRNVTRIGYNPFAWCENLLLESLSPEFPCENGIIYDKNFTHMLCATNRAVGNSFRVKDGITHINRGVFSGCMDLKEIDLNSVTYVDKSAFTNCTSLEYVFIPDSVTYIGEWAFAHCTLLKHISIPRKTFVDKNAFNECNIEIEWRD